MKSRSKTPEHKPLDDEQLVALVSYAAEKGAEWKRELAAEWMRASAPPALHALRNSHGSTWLDAFEFAGARPLFLAVFPSYWGCGPSKEDAIRRARNAGGRGREYYVYAMPEGTTEAYMDAMGSVRWKGGTEGTRPIIVFTSTKALARKLGMEASS